MGAPFCIVDVAGRIDGSCAVGSSNCAALRFAKKRLSVRHLGSSK
jgi:hypothetical protein